MMNVFRLWYGVKGRNSKLRWMERMKCAVIHRSIYIDVGVLRNLLHAFLIKKDKLTVLRI
jgi:hypothetical protein